MNPTPLAAIVRRNRSLIDPALAGATDGELLSRYQSGADQSAFAEIVRRYERAVLAACRQVLSNTADIEDAFQATFLSLVQQAKMVRHDGSLGGWLFAVAHRTAVRSYRTRTRQARREAGAKPASPSNDPGVELSWREAIAALHQELDALPDRYRLPLILCYLDGLSREEAAARLGWKPGSVKAGLERGREKLRTALDRRGVTLSAGLLAAVATVGSTTVASPKLFAAALDVARGEVPACVHKLASSTMTTFAMKAKILLGIAASTILGAGLLAAGLEDAPANTKGPQPAQPSAAKAAKPFVEPTPPPPKKLERVPEPSPELRRELYKFDNEYRHGSEEKFAELEKIADELAKRFPEREDRARIWGEVAHVAAQSRIDHHIERVRKYGRKCLELSSDPLQRPRMYSYLASTVSLSGTAFPKGRRETTEILLTGYREMLAQELPEKRPELPGVDKIGDFDGGGLEEALARGKYYAQLTAREEAKFIRDQIDHREILVMQLRDLYKPNAKYHGRNPEGPEELQTLAAKKLTKDQVSELIKKVVASSER